MLEDESEEKGRTFSLSFRDCKLEINCACLHCKKCWTTALVLREVACSERRFRKAEMFYYNPDK